MGLLFDRGTTGDYRFPIADFFFPQVQSIIGNWHLAIATSWSRVDVSSELIFSCLLVGFVSCL